MQLWLDEKEGVTSVASMDKVLNHLLTFKQMFYYKSSEKDKKIIITKQG